MFVQHIETLQQEYNTNKCNRAMIVRSIATLQYKYSQTCVQRPPLGPEKHGRYAKGCMKKISGK